MTAHYRLGIGVNAAFRTLPTWEGLLRGAAARGGRAALAGGGGGGGGLSGGDGGVAAPAPLLRAYAGAMGAAATEQANRQLRCSP